MNLLITGAWDNAVKNITNIESLGYKVAFLQNENDTLPCTYDWVEGIVGNGVFLYHQIERFRNLKFIQITSAGFDRLPMNYIKNNNIQVFNAKGVYSIPIAEWVILKILEIFKKSNVFYKNQKERKWDKQRDLLELTNKRVAILGYGNVGFEIAKRIKPFDVKLIGVGKRPVESNLLDEYYLIEDIDEVLSKSDIVILTLPLTEQTRHLIDRERIKNMKDNCVFINVSRGGVIDEAALIDAIQDGKFLGVALDVFEKEPLDENHVLWNYENVILTPHNSFVSDRISDRLCELILNNLKNQGR